MQHVDFNTLHKAQSIAYKNEKRKIKKRIQYTALNTVFSIKIMCK